ncbi:hypothetical protein TCAP_03054, partial [Tolypocladium capitatum]
MERVRKSSGGIDGKLMLEKDLAADRSARREAKLRRVGLVGGLRRDVKFDVVRAHVVRAHAVGGEGMLLGRVRRGAYGFQRPAHGAQPSSVRRGAEAAGGVDRRHSVGDEGVSQRGDGVGRRRPRQGGPDVALAGAHVVVARVLGRRQQQVHGPAAQRQAQLLLVDVLVARTPVDGQRLDAHAPAARPAGDVGDGKQGRHGRGQRLGGVGMARGSLAVRRVPLRGSVGRLAAAMLVGDPDRTRGRRGRRGAGGSRRGQTAAGLAPDSAALGHGRFEAGRVPATAAGLEGIVSVDVGLLEVRVCECECECECEWGCEWGCECEGEDEGVEDAT